MRMEVSVLWVIRSLLGIRLRRMHMGDDWKTDLTAPCRASLYLAQISNLSNLSNLSEYDAGYRISWWLAWSTSCEPSPLSFPRHNVIRPNKIPPRRISICSTSWTAHAFYSQTSRLTLSLGLRIRVSVFLGVAFDKSSTDLEPWRPPFWSLEKLPTGR